MTVTIYNKLHYIFLLFFASSFISIGSPTLANDALPAFIQPNICIAVQAVHNQNQIGESSNARTVVWRQPAAASKSEQARHNELRLCFFKRGTQIAVQAYSWLDDRWNGPHTSGLRGVLAKRDFFGKKVGPGCIAIRRALPTGSYGRLKHVMKSDKICGLNDQFVIHHERVIDEGSKVDGVPTKVLRKIFSARIVGSEQPISGG